MKTQMDLPSLRESRFDRPFCRLLEVPRRTDGPEWQASGRHGAGPEKLMRLARTAPRSENQRTRGAEWLEASPRLPPQLRPTVGPSRIRGRAMRRSEDDSTKIAVASLVGPGDATLQTITENEWQHGRGPPLLIEHRCRLEADIHLPPRKTSGDGPTPQLGRSAPRWTPIKGPSIRHRRAQRGSRNQERPTPALIISPCRPRLGRANEWRFRSSSLTPLS